MNSRQGLIEKISESKTVVIKPVSGTMEDVVMDLLAYLSEIQKTDFLSRVIKGPEWGMLARAAGLLSSLDVYFMADNIPIDNPNIAVLEYRPLPDEVDALYPLIYRDLTSKHKEIRIDALNQIGRLADPIFIEHVGEILRSDLSPEVRNKALFALEEINAPEVMAHIEAAMDDEDTIVSYNAHNTLGFLIEDH